MKRRNYDERIQWFGVGRNRSNKKLHVGVPKIADISNSFEQIKSEAAKIESTINEFEKSILLPLVVMLNAARSAQVRRGYADSSSPAYIEYITALALKSDFREMPVPSIKESTSIRNQTERLFWLCNEYWTNRVFASDGFDDESRTTLTKTRLHYMLVRGETYDNYFLDGALRLFSPQAGYLKRKFGFNIEQAITFVKLISHLINERMEKEKPRLKIIFSELANTEVNSTPWPIGVYKNRRSKNLSFEELGISNDLPRLSRDLFLFPENELLQQIISSDRDSFAAFLNWVSIKPGQVDQNFITPLDINPLGNKPVVKLDGQYLFHASAYLARSLVYSLDKELKTDKSYGEKYNHIKAHYVEWESLRLLRKMMPTATACHGLKYSITEQSQIKEVELDGLVQYDNNLFLLECATHPVTEGSKRGMKDPILHDIQQSIVRTFNQAKRAELYIKKTDRPSFTLNDGSIITIDKKSIENYFLLSVTFDSFDVFATDPSRLKSIGLVSKNEHLWPIYIENLKLISDFIEFPSQFIHYLKKRKAVPKNVFASDEIDYFGCYFISNLDFPMLNIKHGLSKLFVVNATSDFDQYLYYKRALKPKVPKPAQVIPTHLKSIIQSLEKHHDPGYTEIVSSLLNIDYPFRKGIEENIILALRRSREAGGTLKDFTAMDPEKEWGFTYFCGDGRQKPTFERMMYLPEHCMRKINETGISSWVGIICDTSIRKPFVKIFFAKPRSKSKLGVQKRFHA
jgi:hypothetical protein